MNWRSRWRRFRTHRGVFALAMLLAGGALGGACSSPSGTPRHAAVEAGADADASTGCVEAGNGFCFVACQDAVADYCSHGGCPPMNWPADPAAAFCAEYPVDGYDITSDRIDNNCGSYRVLAVDGVDTGGYYYYSVDTGKLVAVVGFYNDGSLRCLAGPTGFVEPIGQTGCNLQWLACSDGGTDGGADAGGAGGADSGASGGMSGAGGADSGASGGMSGAGGATDAAPNG